MAMTVIANLGDAAFALPTSTVNGTSTISEAGVIFINNTSGGPITLTLADDLGFLILKDIAGNAGSYPITVACAAAIDGGTYPPLSVPFQWIWLQRNGTGYSVAG
ncbi:MAG TPA: hypothetical protein VGM07_21680 [Stellaceae bacterium]|jgi:hypothetical protein